MCPGIKEGWGATNLGLTSPLVLPGMTTMKQKHRWPRILLASALYLNLLNPIWALKLGKYLFVNVVLALNQSVVGVKTPCGEYDSLPFLALLLIALIS